MFTLAIIFLPGIVWATIDDQYASPVRAPQSQLLISAFLFGVFSYVVVYFIYFCFGWRFDFFTLADVDSAPVNLSPLFDEIAAATFMAVPLATVWLYVRNYKILARIFHRIKATHKYGDEDVWHFLFNVRPQSDYVNLRDFEKKLVYSGYVVAFSESGMLREILLREAQIYDFEGQLLFEMPHLYLARKPDDIHMELPYSPVQLQARRGRGDSGSQERGQ